MYRRLSTSLRLGIFEQRFISMRKSFSTFKLIAVFSILLSSGCYSFKDDRIEITIMNDSTTPTPIYENVTVISGGDKFTWADIKPGATVHVTLAPGKTSDAKVTLMYRHNTEKKFWESDSLPPGIAYKVNIKISADGNATGRFCALPCTLAD